MMFSHLNKKKLVFLSWRVYEKAKEHCITNGTQIAKEILDESRKLRMNFDFKNVQRRVYDALNVLTALDMIKKDRNKIEFIRDIPEVFGDERKNGWGTPEQSREDRQADIDAKIKELNRQKEQTKENINKKKQYFDEITVQVALLKKLVRRNYKQEENETSHNTPNKGKDDRLSLQKFQNTQKIHLPILVLEFKKNSAIEVLMNEDHKELVIISDVYPNLYNDNHVLLNTGLLNESEQGNIESLYETEVKPIISEKDEEDQDMRPPSPNETSRIKINNIKQLRGSIVNISSPYKENVYKESNSNIPFCKSFLSPFWAKYMYQGSPLLKLNLTPYGGQNLNTYTPGSIFGGADNGEENMQPSPFLEKQVSFGLGGY